MRKPLVSVTWLDAHGSSTSELEEHELPSEPAQYTTHGLLVKDCPAGIVVAAEETPQHTYRSWTFIPRGMIVTIKYLEKRGGRKAKRSDRAGRARDLSSSDSAVDSLPVPADSPIGNS